MKSESKLRERVVSSKKKKKKREEAGRRSAEAT
jgi:hypothetical protein